MSTIVSHDRFRLRRELRDAARDLAEAVATLDRLDALLDAGRDFEEAHLVAFDRALSLAEEALDVAARAAEARCDDADSTRNGCLDSNPCASTSSPSSRRSSTYWASR